MKRVKLDRKTEEIKAFIRSLSGATVGSILELDGKPVLKVLPISAEAVDAATLKAALRKRRDESRRLNQDWTDADQELWNKLDEAEE
ncbi:MAG: hypothetical protein JNM56_13895 [Planctomycetia bacterium]|nr:hypothetical protein [Planctomycetia bacterium]